MFTSILTPPESDSIGRHNFGMEAAGGTKENVQEQGWVV